MAVAVAPERATRAGVKHRIYWRDTEPVEPGEPLDRDVRCDVAIVGGGYTGMWTAHFLKEADPALDVHVVEADYAGAGASGHNDGFVTPTIGHSLQTVVGRFGLERAKEGYAALGQSIMDLRRLKRRSGIDSEMEPSGFYLVATKDGQRRRLEHDLETAAKMGVQFELIERDEAQSRIGSPAIQAALHSGGALINPHKLARGLFRLVTQAGVEVHERTPALSIEPATGGHVVTTPGGRIHAEKVVLATNAYQHRLPGFRRGVLPVWSYAMVTEPVADERLAALPWDHREGFVEACNFIVFARLTADNRILIGGGPAPYHFGRDMHEPSHMRNDQVFAALRDAFRRYFPGWEDVRTTHAYGGCVAMTRDLVPHVGSDGRGVFHAYGYCGNGIAMTHCASKALRDLVLERDTELTNLPFVNASEPRFPPEPLAYVGARGMSRLLALQDRFPTLITKHIV